MNTIVSGTCSNGNFVLGDGSCADGGTSQNTVAKCDNTSLQPGDCLTMTVSIPGELNKPGLGAAVVVDKEATTCTASCLAGPSCTACETLPPPGDQCLTRTIGFWGTHPWITNDYDPVTVCGKSLDCSGPDDGKSNPSCLAGSCTSIMEGLGSIPSELPSNQPYVAMVKQLTAAKLNLNATASLLSASCSGFTYQGKTIAQWITACEALCSSNKQTITNSGCIEALDAFNNSQDVITGATPSPFDRPPVDDHGNISGADSSQFTAAQKNGKVIGKGVCQQP